MSIYRVVAFAFCITVCLPAKASATWSIVVLDRATRRIGVAGASCTDDVYGIMGLLPGKGVLIAQAISNASSIQLGMKLLGEGAPADSVWRVISDTTVDRQLATRQYALATLNGDVVQFSGADTPDYHGDRKAAD